VTGVRGDAANLDDLDRLFDTGVDPTLSPGAIGHPSTQVNGEVFVATNIGVTHPISIARYQSRMEERLNSWIE